MMRALLSMVLVVALVAGMVWLPEGSQSKAADSTTSVTFEKYTGWMGDNNDGSLMFRLATQTSLSSYEGQKLRATVLVDGKEQVVDWIVAQVGAQGTLYTNTTAVGSNYIVSTAKSIIVPKGTSFYFISDGTELLQAAADFAITLISSEWTVGYTDAKFAIRYVGDQSNGDTYVALNVDQSVSDLSTTYSSGNKFNSTVLVNGKEQTVTWEYVISGDAQLIRSSYDVDSSNFISTDATRIEIPEGTYLIQQSAAKVPIRVTSEVVLTELGTSNWVEGCIDVGLSYDVVYSGTNFWQVKFKFDGDLSQVTTSTAYVYLDTEIDGTMVEDVAWLINISNGTIYPDGTSPTVPSTATSVKIYAGTYSGGYSGANTTIPIRITNDVGAQYANGTWYNMDNVWTVGATYSSVANIDTKPQIQLTTDVATPDGWSGWFNGTVYIDGAASKARFYFDASSQSLVIGQQMSSGDTSDTVMAALQERKTVKVLAQTVLTPVQSQPGPVVLNLSNDLVLKWNDSAYEEGTESYDISLTFEAVNTDAYASEGYLQVRFKYEGDLSNIPSDVVTAYLATEIDGTVVDNVRWQIDQKNNRLYTTIYASQVPADATSVKIYADTYSSGYTYTSGYTGESHNIPIHITNSVGTQLVLGTWYDAANIRTVGATYKTVVNAGTKPQIQLTTDSANPSGWSGWFNGTIYIGDDEEAANARFYFEQDTQTLYVGQNDASDNAMSAMLSQKTVKIKAQTELSTVQSQTGPVVLNLPEDLILVYSQIGGSWYVEGQEPKAFTTNLIYSSLTEETEAYRLHLVADNYADLVTEFGLWTWFEGTILVNGEETVVAFNLGSDLFATFTSTQNANAGIPLDATSIEIPAGTVFTDVDGSSTNYLEISNSFFYVKVGTAWTTYTKEYQYPNGNVLYYNIDNGSGYMLTSSNGAIEVEELPDLVTGGTISKVGTYNITRVENETLYQEQIVLYKHGDADENNDIDSRDLVAMKWAQAGTSDKQNARQAGTYAADIDRSDDVDGVDLRAMRLALVSDDAAVELQVSKGNSVLNGVMPIAGFTTPLDETYITDEMYKLFAASGINSITYCGNTYDSSATLAEKHLQLAEANNLKLYVTDDTITSMTEDNFASRVGLYSMYHSFAGLHIVDEPTYDVYVNPHGRAIADYTNAISLCNGAANVSGYMNLFPYYSTYTSSVGDATETNYKEYLANTFTSTGAEMLSYDNYAYRLSNDGFLWWDDYQITPYADDYYVNLEMARKQVEGTDKPFWVFAQAGLSLKEEYETTSTLQLTAAEQQWQINTALALGAKGVQYWQLFQGDAYAPYSTSGLISATGTINETYYNAAQEQNAFIAVVDEVLMNATNEGVIVNDSTASDALSSDVVITQGTSEGYNELASVVGTNAFVGCFDYYGKTVLYVVNCDTASPQEITLTYKEECAAAVTTFDATTLNRTPAASATSTTISVGAGEAALVIIE